MPKGYVLAEIDVTDPQGYEAYKKLSSQAAADHGGRFLVRGGEVTHLEGERAPNRIVILEFDSPEQAQAFFNSPQYQAAAAVRRRASVANFYCLTGA
ncbi:DUF1330 domain-containing protein [bacterium]|nr:MAG: DUF1330 domain-containing protein [bacterium]